MKKQEGISIRDSDDNEKKTSKTSGWVDDKWKGFLVALSYGVISVSITFFNKAVLSYYEFPYSNMLTLGQMIFSIVFLVSMKRIGVIKYPDFSWDYAKKLLPLAIYFTLMAASGLWALALVNVPVFSALRRLATLIVIVGERFVLGKITPPDETNSVVLMVFGAIIAGWGDLTFDLLGYTLILFNCFVTAGYLIYIAKKKQETGLNTFGLMFYCNFLSLPGVALIVYFTELDGMGGYPYYSNVGFQICFLMSSVQAFLLNYFIFLCSTINSPLTTSITGQLKAILSTILGLFMFSDVSMNLLLGVGLFISSVASIWYSYIKYLQQVRQLKQSSSQA